MLVRTKRWQVALPLPRAEHERFGRFHPILARILYNRGLTDPAEAEAFLRGDVAPVDPFRMQGMNKAVERIRRAIKSQQPVVVYGDFDADGVTSTVLLVSVLRALGAHVRPYIPHRVDEGYGLNDKALLDLAAQGTRLVITVDCGVRSLHEVETGIQAGLDIIVTDHHSVGPEVPQCTAVINPKQEGCLYPEKMLAGVGVAYKLAEALYKVSANQDRTPPPFALDELLDLVAIGTVADLAPLDRPENRALVIGGLYQLRHANRLGVRALLDVARVEPESVDAWTIGFTIGPRINAAGRLDSATIAYNLLSTNDPEIAAARARELQSLNERRQQLTRDMQDYARSLLPVEPGDDLPLIFAADPSFAQGIVGLVAGRLAEEFYRPAIVLHQGEHESHGSCRSIVEFNITEALDECGELLIRHGGHAQAAGFAILNENLPRFREQITAIAAAHLRGQDLRPTLEVDAEVPIGEVDERLYSALRQLEPCGNSMGAPVLCARNLRVVDVRPVGKESAHLKLRFVDKNDPNPRNYKDAIAFRMGHLAEDLSASVRDHQPVDIAFQPDLNTWNGNTRIELKIHDIQPAE